MTGRDAALSELGAARQLRQDAERAETTAVAGARAAGATWQQIADVLRIQQPNAVRKYKPAIEGTHS